MNKNNYLLSIAALFLLHIFIGTHVIKRLSPTYDEHVHLVSGYSYFKTTDYTMNGFGHPPLAEMWSAVPLLFMSPSFQSTHPFWSDILAYQYAFSDLFMYHNRVDAEKMLFAGRFMILLLSLALGFMIFLWSRKLFGDNPALIAVFLWSFSPAFLAHGTLITTDMVITLTYFMFFYFLWRLYTEKATLTLRLLTGASLGLLMISKFSAVAVFPAAGLIILYQLKYAKIGMKRVLADLVFVVPAAIVTMLIVYQFVPLTSFYIPGLQKMMGGILQGRSTFLMGQYSTSGWLYYFPVVFLLKTPIPFIVLAVAALFSRNLRTRNIAFFLLIPALVYFGMSCFSKVQIGYRHIMPALPFLTVLISGLFYEMRKTIVRVIAGALLIWYALGTAYAYPWYVSYFNEYIGKADNGYLYLTDSNLDWGQGMKELSKYLKSRNISSVIMCYFGVSDPHYYGIKYRPVGFIDTISDGSSTPLARALRPGDIIDFSKEPATLFVISATNLQATYYADKNIFGFLKEIKPDRIIANSMFVYDMTAHPEQYAKLKVILGE